MQRSLLFVAMLALVTGCRTTRQAEVPTGPNFRILTYNVNWGGARPELAAQAIRGSGADIVCLQETTPAWEQYLRGSLGREYSFIKFHHSQTRYGGGLAFLSKLSSKEVAFVPSETGWFDGWIMKFETEFGPVQVLNVHLRPPISDGGSWVSGYFSTRDDQVREMQLFYAKRATGIPTLVAGDFNASPNSPVVSWLKQNGMANALPKFDSSTATWHWQYGPVSLKRCMDHILFSPELHCAAARVIQAGASDHFPVEAVFASASTKQAPGRKLSQINLRISSSRLVPTLFSDTFRGSIVDITKEIQKRRTFAIISHPDAGKTTLTEKLLLYGGAVQLAGSVTARKNQRATTSDWMELEKKRGISISSTVLQFEYDGYRINLLDTPGHKDFSEDTYRVLTAVDSVVMVIDSAKGIEPQTRKLFEVCRQRAVPIFTFMNKCDRPMKNPLELLDELERVLGIGAFPVNWPIGNGFDFQGVYDRQTQLMHLFERTVGGQYRAPVQVGGLHDDIVRGRLDDETFHKTVEELEMLEHAGHDWDDAAVLSEKTTPVFFGSASNNFGVQLLLDGFLKHSPAPKPRVIDSVEIAPENPAFSGFIFKIQANMDPKHRDRIAFIRVCSGKFERDMTVHHSRSEKKVRLSSSHKIFGNERETVNEAYPGDVIGLVGHDSFGIGDTLSTDPKIVYHEIPRFTPEAFSYLHNPNTAKYKQFRQGLDQLLQEGVIQALYLRNSSVKTPLLAAVGPLQFEVVQFRLENEYGAQSRLESAPWTVVRWLPTDLKEDDLDALSLPTGSRIAYDIGKNPVVLFSNDWSANYFLETNKNCPLSALPIQTAKE